MAKKKDVAALFEAISKSKQRRSEAGLSVPAWMGPTPQVPEQPPAPEVEPKEEPSAPVEPPAKGLFTWVKEKVSLVNGRVQVSLNFVTCAVVLLGLAVVLVLAFGLGRWTAPEPQGAPAREMQTAGVADSDTTSPPGPPPTGDDASATPGPKGRIVGKYYLVIQNLRAKDDPRLQDAHKIANFCEEHGYPAEVAELPSSYIVWSLTPFDSGSPDDPEVRRFALNIEELGKEYQRQGGIYNFMQRRSPGVRLDPMLIRYNPDRDGS